MSESIRHHVELAEIFRRAESRHLTAAEMAVYRAVVPHHKRRADAAVAIASHEPTVVRDVVSQIFALFPYEARHELASAKCTRDIRYVSAYATLTMLMGDPDWFDEKLLIWMRTILQAFEFPGRESRRKLLFGAKRKSPAPEASSKVQSIKDTYERLRDGYAATLPAPLFAEMRPYLQQAVDRLSEEVT